MPTRCAMAFLGATVVAGLGLQESPVRCHASEGAAVHVRVLKTGKRTPTSTVVSYEGKAIDATTLSVELKDSVELEYLDKFVEMHDGELHKAQREFPRVRRVNQEIHRPPSFEKEETVEDTEVSALEGRRISISWSPESHDYRMTVDSGGPELDIAAFREPILLSLDTSFLSPKNASESREWELPFSLLRHVVLVPSGDLFSLPSTPQEPGTAFATRQRTAFWNAVEGNASAKIAGPVDDSHPLRIKIVITGEARAKCTLTYDPTGSDSKGRTLSGIAKLAGIAIWDSEHDRLESIKLDWNGTIDLVQDLRLVSENGQWGQSVMKLDDSEEWNVEFSYEPNAEPGGK